MRIWTLAALIAAVSPPGASLADTSGAKARTFLIAPEDSGKVFLCPSGVVQSVTATAVSENRAVTLVLLDSAGNPIPEETWAAAYGFRLNHRQQVKVRVIMICGP